MKENKIVDLSKQFAIDIVKICDKICADKSRVVLGNQLLKSGTSIGANAHEANYASSLPDFINKLQIALKECYETDYWLGLLKDTEIIDENIYGILFAKCSKLRAMLIASINTAKAKI